MSEFEVSTWVTDKTTSVNIVNETDGIYINVEGVFHGDISEDIGIEGVDSVFPAYIPVDKWEAYKAEIDKAVATYRELRNKQS